MLQVCGLAFVACDPYLIVWCGVLVMGFGSGLADVKSAI